MKRWGWKARDRSKGWSSQEPNIGQVQNCPEQNQATTRGYFPAQQGQKEHSVRSFQRKCQDCMTLTGFMFSDLMGWGEREVLPGSRSHSQEMSKLE